MLYISHFNNIFEVLHTDDGSRGGTTQGPSSGMEPRKVGRVDQEQ